MLDPEWQCDLIHFCFACSAFCRWSALPLCWGSSLGWVLAALLLSALRALSLVASSPSWEGLLPPPVMVGRAGLFPWALRAYLALLVIYAVGPSARGPMLEGGLAGSVGAKKKGQGASPPTFWEGFPAAPGRPDTPKSTLSGRSTKSYTKNPHDMALELVTDVPPPCSPAQKCTTKSPPGSAKRTPVSFKRTRSPLIGPRCPLKGSRGKRTPGSS